MTLKSFKNRLKIGFFIKGAQGPGSASGLRGAILFAVPGCWFFICSPIALGRRLGVCVQLSI